MSGIRLTSEELNLLMLFENVTKTVAKDCIIDNKEGRIIFVVKPEDIGQAIGKRGANIKKIREQLGRPIDIVELSDTPEKFIENALSPARVESINIVKTKEKLIAFVKVSAEDRGIAIGKNGKNVARARMLAKRHFGIDDVVIN